MKKKITLRSLNLDKGTHESAEYVLRVMEAVSYFAGEPHSDKPQCACPVLTSYMIKLNDNLGDKDRKKLKPYIKKLIGPRDGLGLKRLEILVHYAVTKVVPRALRLTLDPGLIKYAEELEDIKMGDYVGAYSVISAAADATADPGAHAAAFAAYVAVDAAVHAAAIATYVTVDAAYTTYATRAAVYAANAHIRAGLGKKYYKLALSALDEALKVK